MRSLLIVLASVSVMSLPTFAAETNMTGQEPSSSEMYYSPQVCQFSLTSYSGTIDSSGDTSSFQVGLSCPQEEDVRASVGVIIDNALVASKVVTVSAGKDYSQSVYIPVGSQFIGKKYNLVVQ